MKKLVVYCCCGVCDTVLWESTWDHDNPEFTLYEGMGSECVKCADTTRFKREFKREQPVSMYKDENTDDFDAFMARRKELGRNQGRKKRGAR